MGPTLQTSARRAKTAAIAISLILVAGLSTAAEMSAPSSPTDALRAHARYLASDGLMGRGVGTPGIKLARDYIARQFAQYGLLPGGHRNGYLQSFGVAAGVEITQPTHLSVDGESLALHEDWLPLGISASGEAEAELVFAGYGITAKDYGYDDYAGVDVKGKIAVLLRYEPPPRDDKSPFRKLPEYSQHATLRAKANNARDHGALGMILVDLHRDGAQERELISLRRSLWRGGKSLMAAQVKRRIAEEWFERGGISLAALKGKIDSAGRPASLILRGSRIALSVTLREIQEETENVIGILPGANPRFKNEHIVIGAHYDHLGFGNYGTLDSSAEGRVHHGADDNASGTAMLLGLAEQLARSAPKPGRTIVFAAFSGEELGLFGSRHYVNDPALPLSTSKAMINLDMVGRLRDDQVMVFGARSAKELSPIVVAEAHNLGLEVVQSDGIGRSDNMSFYSKQIPVLHFFTGSHADYHRPTDTSDKLNYEGMNRIAALVLATARRLADIEEPLKFAALPGRSRGDETARTASTRSYLGSIPDYGGASDGVKLAGVSPGSPAAHAGLREGDVIIQFAGAKIVNIEDLTAELSVKKPGDKVEIVVRRGSELITLNAELRARS